MISLSSCKDLKDSLIHAMGSRQYSAPVTWPQLDGRLGSTKKTDGTKILDVKTNGFGPGDMLDPSITCILQVGYLSRQSNRRVHPNSGPRDRLNYSLSPPRSQRGSG